MVWPVAIRGERVARLAAETILGLNVGQLCAARGWDRTTLSAQLGWTPDDIAALEAGTLDATLDQIDALAALFGVTAQDLLQAPIAIQAQSRPHLRYA